MNAIKFATAALFGVLAFLVAVFVWLYRKAQPAEKYLKANKEHQ